MDPETRRMMGLRADMTPQVARIATTRLASAPRPLRLSYAGQCLRVQGGQLAPDRQIAQAGMELIGADTPAADAEIVLVAAEALAAVGLRRISVDLLLPPLVPALMDDAGIGAEQRRLLAHALDRKDAAWVAAQGGALAGTLNDLLMAAGPADGALAALRSARLPAAARAMAERVEAVVAAIREVAPGLRLTVDPVEFRGLRYHTGLSMTVYAPGRHEELGRGGRYVCGRARAGHRAHAVSGRGAAGRPRALGPAAGVSAAGGGRARRGAARPGIRDRRGAGRPARARRGAAAALHAHLCRRRARRSNGVGPCPT